MATVEWSLETTATESKRERVGKEGGGETLPSISELNHRKEDLIHLYYIAAAAIEGRKRENSPKEPGREGDCRCGTRAGRKEAGQTACRSQD